MPLRNVLLNTLIEKISSYVDKRLTDRPIQGLKDGQSDDSEWHLTVYSLILNFIIQSCLMGMISSLLGILLGQFSTFTWQWPIKEYS